MGLGWGVGARARSSGGRPFHAADRVHDAQRRGRRDRRALRPRPARPRALQRRPLADRLSARRRRGARAARGVRFPLVDGRSGAAAPGSARRGRRGRCRRRSSRRAGARRRARRRGRDRAPRTSWCRTGRTGAPARSRRSRARIAHREQRVEALGAGRARRVPTRAARRRPRGCRSGSRIRPAVGRIASPALITRLNRSWRSSSGFADTVGPGVSRSSSSCDRGAGDRLELRRGRSSTNSVRSIGRIVARSARA